MFKILFFGALIVIVALVVIVCCIIAGMQELGKLFDGVVKGFTNR